VPTRPKKRCQLRCQLRCHRDYRGGARCQLRCQAVSCCLSHFYAAPEREFCRRNSRANTGLFLSSRNTTQRDNTPKHSKSGNHNYNNVRAVISTKNQLFLHKKLSATKLQHKSTFTNHYKWVTVNRSQQNVDRTTTKPCASSAPTAQHCYQQRKRAISRLNSLLYPR